MAATINNESTTTTEPTPWNRRQPQTLRGLNIFYWYQIFALYSVVVKTQKWFSSHVCVLTNTMYHHRETI